MFNKIVRHSRIEISGAVLPTLQEPDFGIRNADGNLLYIKRFGSGTNDSTYNVAVVNKHGELEDYICSVHIKNGNYSAVGICRVVKPQTRLELR